MKVKKVNIIPLASTFTHTPEDKHYEKIAKLKTSIDRLVEDDAVIAKTAELLFKQLRDKQRTKANIVELKKMIADIYS